MKKITNILSLTMISLCGQAFAANCNMPPVSHWKNDFGSTMTIKVGEYGSLSGEFRSGIGCGIGKQRFLVGVCNGDAVSFIVNWDNCDSLTSWTGIYEPGKITSLWNLVVANNPQEVHTGADIFVLSETN